MNFIIYRYRFLIVYVIIGFISISFELITNKILNTFFLNTAFNNLISTLIGILIAFWLNSKYNFKISTAKLRNSIKYFFLISSLSNIFQYQLNKIINLDLTYEFSRYLIAGSFFWMAYLLHKKFSFKDYKKVGVAIYANGVEDVTNIFNKVGNYPDFIHIDIVDKTINNNAQDVLTYKTEVIKAYWNQKFIEAHIMSKTPKKWVLEIMKDVDRIYLHLDIEDDIFELLNLIKSENVEPGIVIQNESGLKFWNEYPDIIESILVLAIKNPGYSGQTFEFSSMNIIKRINESPNRDKISLNVDGGIGINNIANIKSENVVSGSYVLNSINPKKNIMILQTSSKYESDK